MFKLFGVLTFCLAACIPAVFAEEGAVKPPEIGEKAPEWKQLKGTDGKLHSLAGLAGSDVVVVCFTCNSCPYSVDYEDRMIAFQQRYLASDQKVTLVAINSNLVPADSMQEMQKRAEQKKFNFAYLLDETQEVAKAYGAIYTPEFFVLNRDRRIVFKGAMDDSTNAKDVKVNFVERAVTAALNNKMPEVTSAGARGCAIRFKRPRR